MKLLYRFQNRRVKHKKEVINDRTGLRMVSPDHTRFKEENCTSASCRCNCSIIRETSSDSLGQKTVASLVPTSESEAKSGPIVNEGSNTCIISGNNKDISDTSDVSMDV